MALAFASTLLAGPGHNLLPRNQPAASAQTALAVGLDMDAFGNTATSLGPIDACTRVHAGADFEVDVYLKDVPAIDGVQVTVHYDPQILRPLSRDVSLFLNVASGSNASDFHKASDEPGEYLLAGFDLGQNSAESGSGAAIRVVFEAVAAGTSELRASDFLMVDAAGAPVPPADSSGRFTGTITGGVVAVDTSCELPATPPAEATTSPGPTTAASPRASITAVPRDETAAAQTPVAAGSMASGTQPATAGTASDTSGGPAGAAGTAAAPEPSPTFRAEARASSRSPEAAGDAQNSGVQQSSGDEEGVSWLWWMLPAAGAIVVAGAALVWRRYRAASDSSS